MKNTLLLGLTVMTLFVHQSAMSQVSGNAQWNENNRFKNNDDYQDNDKAAPPAAMEAQQYSSGRAAVAQGYQQQQQYKKGKPFEVPTWNSGNELTIKVNILNNVVPTSYIAIFHMNQAGKKISELDSLLSKRLHKFIDLGKTIGLTDKDFYLDMIAMVPIFEREKKLFSKSYIEVPKGFEMQKNIHIRYTNPAHLDRLYAMAAQCEIYDLIKVEYLYDSIEVANANMRNKAQAILKEKIKNFAKTGIMLDTCYRSITEMQNQYFPVDQYKSYKPLAVSTLEDDASTSNEGSKIAISKPYRTTLFYNQLPTSGFDAVINPSPLKPTIQMVYTMEIKFRRNQPVQVIYKNIEQTKYLLITPQGTIKEWDKTTN